MVSVKAGLVGNLGDVDFLESHFVELLHLHLPLPTDLPAVRVKFPGEILPLDLESEINGNLLHVSHHNDFDGIPNETVGLELHFDLHKHHFEVSLQVKHSRIQRALHDASRQRPRQVLRVELYAHFNFFLHGNAGLVVVDIVAPVLVDFDSVWVLVLLVNVCFAELFDLVLDEHSLVWVELGAFLEELNHFGIVINHSDA